MKCSSFFLVVSIMFSSFQVWGVEIVTDDRYFKMNSEGISFSPEDIESIGASREAALADIQLMEGHLEKLTQFRQANDRAYGLPSDPAELEQMLTQARAFADNDRP